MLNVVSRIRERARVMRRDHVHARHKRLHAQDYSQIAEIVRRYRENGGLTNSVQEYKLWNLRHILNERQPKSILELGAGTTTAVFADYVRSHPGSSLTSIDESAHWLENARDIAKIESGDMRFRLVTAERAIHQLEELRATRYAIELDDAFDLVLIDGPSLRIDGIRDKSVVNSDILNIVKHHAPRRIIVDGRHATVKMLKRKLEDRFHILESEWNAWPKLDYRYFTEFALG
jgi:hypothetical protein